MVHQLNGTPRRRAASQVQVVSFPNGGRKYPSGFTQRASRSQPACNSFTARQGEHFQTFTCP